MSIRHLYMESGPRLFLDQGLVMQGMESSKANKVTILFNDALAPCLPRTSADKIMDRRNFVCLNPLVPGRSGCDFKNVIFNLVLLISIFTSYETVVR